METGVNNKCKAFTSLEQSKKLAEILPLESADMVYTITNGYHTPWIRIEKIDELYKDDVCAWSLAALLDFLPLEIETHKQTDGYKTYYYVESYMKHIGKEKYLSTERHENLVDACVAMIEKLHELKML